MLRKQQLDMQHVNRLKKMQVECQRFSASFTSLNFLTDVGPKQGQTSAKMVLQYIYLNGTM